MKMTMMRRPLVASLSFLALFCKERVSSFSTIQMTPTTARSSSSNALNALHADDLDSAELATPLRLTLDDFERFQSLKTRQVTMPILILDSVLPKQHLSFESSDPKFVRLLEHCLEHDCDVGLLGVNPHTGAPLSRGVTFTVKEDSIDILPNTKSVVLSVEAGRRMEIQNEPFLDDTGSFYLADVELIDDRKEPPLSPEQENIVQQLSETLPEAMDEWSDWVLKAGKTTDKGLDNILSSLGPMPTDRTDRAFWVAAAINPMPSLDACLEIRPAMLSCTNDYERMVLACQAVRSSIDHLSGKRRLF